MHEPIAHMDLHQPMFVPACCTLGKGYIRDAIASMSGHLGNINFSDPSPQHLGGPKVLPCSASTKKIATNAIAYAGS